MSGLCQCGCGKECKNKFVHGHNGRGVPRSENEIALMKKHWDENREQWSLNAKLSWTDELKEHHRKINIGKKLTQEHRNKIGSGNTGKTRTDDFKNKVSESLKGRFIGDNNPFWKGGTSRIYKNGYYSPQYLEWRKKVFERDNYICQSCGDTSVKYVTAHHIKSFAKYPELRFDVNNGQTLCESCHCKVDNYRARFKTKQLYN